jgi:hypothetical protein
VLGYGSRTFFLLDLFRLSRWCWAVGLGQLGGAVEKCGGGMGWDAMPAAPRGPGALYLSMASRLDWTRFRSAFFGAPRRSSMIRRRAQYWMEYGTA